MGVVRYSLPVINTFFIFAKMYQLPMTYLCKPLRSFFMFSKKMSLLSMTDFVAKSSIFWCRKCPPPEDRRRGQQRSKSSIWLPLWGRIILIGHYTFFIFAKKCQNYLFLFFISVKNARAQEDQLSVCTGYLSYLFCNGL
jgi:hypothetical protein